MPGKKLPTDLIVAMGAKHLSTQEEDTRRRTEVHIEPPAEIVPPKWLTKAFHREFLELARILSVAGLYAELDRDALAQFLVCRDRWRRADRKASAAIGKGDVDAAGDWTRIQGAYFKQCRQVAEAMGLSVTSRCRLVLPGASGFDPGAGPMPAPVDDFQAILQARQRAAMQSG